MQRRRFLLDPSFQECLNQQTTKQRSEYNRICIYIYVMKYIYVYMYTHTHTYAYAYADAYAYAHAYASAYASAYAYADKNIYTCINAPPAAPTVLLDMRKLFQMRRTARCRWALGPRGGAQAGAPYPHKTIEQLVQGLISIL